MRTTAQALRIHIANLNHLSGRPMEPVVPNGQIARDARRPNALFLIDRGSNYPYRYSLGVRNEKVGCYGYYMGGTGRYYTAAGMAAYLDGIENALVAERAA